MGSERAAGAQPCWLGQGALQGALAALAARKLGPGQLSRVSLDADGRIQLEAESAGSSLWFSYSRGHLHRVHPGRDGKIPLLNPALAGELPPALSVVAYRPGRRVVLAFADATMFLKGYRRGRGARAALRHDIALSASRDGGLEVPKPIDWRSDEDALALARQPGASPEVSVAQAPTWSAIGAGLRRFQSACDRSELASFSHSDEIAVLDELARRFRLCDLDLPPGWQAGRDALAAWSASLPTDTLGASHRDLHDGQFLVSGGRLSLLDFDLLCVADNALDAGNLIAHLHLRDLQRTPGSNYSASRACAIAFLAGLGRHRDEAFQARLRFYQATSFYRLALLYALRPRWNHLVISLLELGQQQLAGAGRYGY